MSDYLRAKCAHATRVWLARFYPALNSGCAAAVIGVKTGLARLGELEERTGAGIYPIVGVGRLPFRGGLAPRTIRKFGDEYLGTRTVTIQSGLRYDHSLKEVGEAVKKLL